MRKFLIIFLIFICTYQVQSQFSTAVGAYRVVFVSPNYPAIYPRYRTLQQVWNAIKDSASVTTGKYFVINAVTAYNNISDWTSGYKDSIVSRDPYMKITAFGQSVNDSIVGVTTEEFSLVAGILSLNSLIAGDGLSFPSHTLKVNTKNPIWVSNDTVFFRYDASNFTLVGGTFTWYKTTNSGIQSTASGFQVLPRLPLFTVGDTLGITRSYQFQNTDSLWIDLNTWDFTQVYGSSPAISINLDSGMISTVNGLKVTPDWLRITYNTAGKLTLPSALAGIGLIWTGDSLNIGLSSQFQSYNDSLWINFNMNQFQMAYGVSPAVNIRLDSGMTTNTGYGIKPKIDYATLIFNSALQLIVNPTLAGSGLLMTAGIINIVTNDFAKLENDTLKIKTSTLLCYRFDSLTTLTAYDINADTVGYGMSANGMLKRVSVSYKTDSGNDTVVVNIYDKTFASKDRISVINYLLGTGLQIYKNGINLQTITLPNFTAPYYRRINVVIEVYQEAQ